MLLEALVNAWQRDAHIVILASSSRSGGASSHLTGCHGHLSVGGGLADAPAISSHDLDVPVPAVLRLSGSHCLLVLLLLSLGGLGGLRSHQSCLLLG